jgi:hypothetical protein
MPSSQKNRQPKRRRPRRTPAPESTSLIQNVTSIQRSTDSRIVRAAKIVDKGSLSGGAADVLSSLTFTLNDLPEVASFTNLFDQYRFDSIDVYFIPLTSRVLPASAALVSSGLLVSAVDYDDSGVPASLAVVLNYQNAKLHPAGTPHTISFVPHVAINTYTGAFGAFANASKQWIDAASQSVVHFGIKTAITGSSNWPTWRVICRYHVSFKSPR